MFFVIKRGTIIAPKWRGGDGHLNVILTSPQGDRGEVLLVPFCSVKPEGKHDRSCLLGQDDHSFLKHESYVAYAFLRIERAAAIAESVNKGLIEAHEICSTELHALICGGLFKSPFAAIKYVQFYERSLLGEDAKSISEEDAKPAPVKPKTS